MIWLSEIMHQSFQKLTELAKKLREECPWDRKQTIQSFYPFILKEAKEFDEAAKRGDAEGMKDELGDVLWDIFFIAELAEKEGLFRLKDVLDNAHEKYVRRHPHVFKGEPDDEETLHRRWEEIKKEERDGKIKKAQKQKSAETTDR